MHTLRYTPCGIYTREAILHPEAYPPWYTRPEHTHPGIPHPEVYRDTHSEVYHTLRYTHREAYTPL